MNRLKNEGLIKRCINKLTSKSIMNGGLIDYWIDKFILYKIKDLINKFMTDK